MSFRLNPLFTADSYKYGHINFYPKGVTEVYSNFTPRSVKHLNVPEQYKTNQIVWFGGEAVVRDMTEMWREEFFAKPVEQALLQFQRVIANFAGGNYDASHFEALHRLGYLPLEFKTLPEGSLVDVGIPVMTVRNTLPEFYWLTNFIESYISAEMWKMSTSATIAFYYRKIIERWADITGGNKDFVDFQAHDFSYRGMSGTLDAIRSASGHLTSFKGSDTVGAVPYLEYHYSGSNTFIAASVPATEHSIQTAFVENDYEYIRHIIEDCVPKGIVSVVADGYDYWAVLTDVLPRLKSVILNRQPDAMGFAKTVIRPDSGDPVRIIAGYSEDEIVIVNSGMWKQYFTVDTNKELTLEEIKGSVQVLWELFGGTTNDKGFKTLDQHIGLIYGDSITLARAEEILKRLHDKGFASDNIVFGVGSYTYQYNTRDTLGFAMKATNITKDGVDVPLFKDPKTDDGTKKSAKGLLTVLTDYNVDKQCKVYQLVDMSSRELESGHSNTLTTLYKDGKFLKHDTLVEIRQRIRGE